MTMKGKVEKLEAQAHTRKKSKPVMRRIVRNDKEVEQVRKEFENAKGKFSKLKLIRIARVDFSKPGRGAQAR